jgi:hypothetical protein
MAPPLSHPNPFSYWREGEVVDTSETLKMELNIAMGVVNLFEAVGAGIGWVTGRAFIEKSSEILASEAAVAAPGLSAGSAAAAAPAAAEAVAGGGRHIALGLERFGLKQVAEKVGAETLLKDPNWKATLLKEIANPSSSFTVSVEGLNGTSVAGKVLSAAQQGIRAGATPTNWELAQLYQAGRLSGVTFVNRAGEILANPF